MENFEIKYLCVPQGIRSVENLCSKWDVYFVVLQNSDKKSGTKKCRKCGLLCPPWFEGLKQSPLFVGVVGSCAKVSGVGRVLLVCILYI